MNCPKDSNYWWKTKERAFSDVCSSTIRRIEHKTYTWECTRPKGHTGKHHAHTKKGYRCCKTWTTEEAVIEAL